MSLSIPQKNDRHGCEQFQKLYYRTFLVPATAFVKSFLGTYVPPHLVEDTASTLLADMMEKIWTNYDYWFEISNRSNNQLTGCLYASIKNLAIDYARGMKANPLKRPFVSIDNMDVQFNGDIYNELTSQELVADILAFGTRRLSLLRKKVFHLFFIENWTHKQIAIELGISEKQSSSTVYQIRKIIQKHFGRNPY